jgi:hypothetical protein
VAGKLNQYVVTVAINLFFDEVHAPEFDLFNQSLIVFAGR